MIPHTTTMEVKVDYDGTELVEEREAAGLNQAALARRLGWHHQQLSRLEKPGKRRMCRETWDKIMEAIKKPL